MRYSQNNEEDFIINNLGDTGRFLDIGAYDGKTFSNTLRLVELGWSGVCYEPSPSVFPALQLLHEKNDKITCIPKALGKEAGTFEFFDSNGDAISSFSKSHKNKWEKGWKCEFTTVEVEAVSISSVFEDYGYDFDFINLDVESTNLELFNLMPFEKLYNLKMICVEHDGNCNKMLERVRPLGFKEISRNGENLILFREYT